MTWVAGLQLLGGTFYTAGGGNKRRFAEQINTIIMSNRGNKVLTGCTPSVGVDTNLALTGDHLNIASGNVLVAGTLLSFSEGDVDLVGAQSGLTSGESRYVLITIYNNGGTATLKATNGVIGTDGNQEPYEALEDEVGICIVYLTFADTTMSSNQIGFWELFTEDGFALKDDGIAYFGNDGDFQLTYDSANGWLQLSDGTNDFLRVTDLGAYPEFDFFGNVDVVDHDLSSKGLKLAGTLLTASATELNLLDNNIGIAIDNLVKIAVAASDDDFAKFTTTGLEGRTYAEVKTDLSLDAVENTALTTWTGAITITSVGIIGTGEWQGTDVADDFIASAVTWNAKQDGLNFGITNGYVMKAENTPVDDEYARFTATGLEGRSFSELKNDLGLSFGTISGTPNINQSLLTTSFPTFANLKLTGAEIDVYNNSGVSTLTIENSSSSYMVNLEVEGRILAAYGDLRIGLSSKNFEWSTSTMVYAEFLQLCAIGANTISSTQWGYLGAMNQSLTQTSNVSFIGLTMGGSLNLNDQRILNFPSNTASGSTIVRASADGGLYVTSSTIRNKIVGEELIIDPKITYEMKPKQWHWKDSGDWSYGFIAEDLEILDRRMGLYNNEGLITDYDNRRLIATLVMTIQDLNNRLKILEV